LYSSQGVHRAMQAQKALGILAPNNKFITAYLSFNNAGMIASSHLLFDIDHPNSHIASDPRDGNGNAVALALATQERHGSLKSDVDLHHPLLLQLNALAHERTQTLKQVSDQIVELLNQRNEGRIHDFTKRYKSLSQQYGALDEEHKEKMSQALADLYREYSYMSLAEFTSYLQAAHLEILAQETFAYYRPTLLAKEVSDISEARVQAKIEQIQQAKNFAELDAVVNETAELLTLEHVPHAEHLIRYQNTLRNHVIQQLSRFLLSPDGHLPATEFHEENRARLMQILKMAWITDPEEVAFYLNEFKILLQAASKE
jgi:hypothetical protein